MKEILYRRNCNVNEGTKSFSTVQKTEDTDCATEIVKGFNYQLEAIDELDCAQEAPEIHIRKAFDTKKYTEEFEFTVKGRFPLKQGRSMYQVNFEHKLHITIQWKNKKAFSPKKSEILA